MVEARLNNAIHAAVRFIELANKAKLRAKTVGHTITGTKEMGAAKRASLDLTRSLAEFRKGNS